MNRKTKKNLKIGFRRAGDVLIVKILDMTNNVFYKKRVAISDVKGIRELLFDLDAYGLDLKKLMEEEKYRRWW